MKPKQLVILAILLAAAVVAALLISKKRNKTGDENAVRAGEQVFPDLAVNDVARVSIVSADETVTVSQKDGNGAWGVDDRGGFAADVAKLRTFVLDFSKLKVAQTTTAGASQMGRLGLLAPDSAEGTEEEKGTRVEFAAGDGTALVKATVGKEFKTGGGDPSMGGYATGRYLLVDGRPEVLVISDQLYSMQTKPSDWLKKESFRVEKPKKVTLTYPDGEGSFTLTKEEEAGQFKLGDLSETETLDDSKTGGFGNIFSSGSFADVLVGEEATDEKTGLDAPTNVEIETFDGFKYVVSIGKKTGEGEESEGDANATPPTVRYPVRYTVSAEPPVEPAAPEGETEEQKKEREAAFALKQTTSKEKLETEKALEGTIFLMESWVIDQVLKKRADLIKAPEPAGEEADGGAAALPSIPGAGISATTPPVAVPPLTGEAPKEPITAVTPPVSLEDAKEAGAGESDAPGEGEPMPEESPAAPAEPAPAEGEGATAPAPPATEEPAPAPSGAAPGTPDAPAGTDAPETPESEPSAEGDEDAGKE